MGEVSCPNCEYSFSIVKTYCNAYGLFTVCPNCKVSFNTEEEVELNDDQVCRCDEIENAVYEMCKVFCEKDDLKWDISFIGEIADAAAEILTMHGFRVRYPAIVTEQDGSQWIKEYDKRESEN